MSFRSIIGSFRLLRRRAVEVQQPGLVMWADQGERATAQVKTLVRDAAHESEVCDCEASREIAAGLDGLKDGRVDAVDIEHFQRAARLADRAASRAHDLGEATQL